MSSTTDSSVGAFLAHHPAAAPVLLRHGIDFCCGGARDLPEACQRAGVHLETLLAEVALAEAVPEAPRVRWDREPIDELIQHILSAHHAPLATLLPRLGTLAWRVAEAHGETHGASLTALAREVATLADELQQHMHKEEQVLFPWLLSGNGATAGGPIHCMEQEHDDASRSLSRIRELSDDFQPPAEACTSWRALLEQLAWLDCDLRVHIHLENNVLFPRALRGEPPRHAVTDPSPRS
jgi:regulator of cell morphogenesis and NO signaling